MQCLVWTSSFIAILTLFFLYPKAIVVASNNYGLYSSGTCQGVQSNAQCLAQCSAFQITFGTCPNYAPYTCPSGFQRVGNTGCCPDQSLGQCDLLSGICCAPVQNNPPSVTCTSSGGTCQDALRNPNCPSGQLEFVSLDSTCPGPNDMCCNYPQTCDQLAQLEGASSSSCTGTYRACTNSGGVPIPGNDFQCGGYCCLFYPTPTPIPNCNSGIVCNNCSGAPVNSCYGGNGSQTCDYTSPQLCSVGGFTQSCTYINCSNNYSCPSGNYCQTYLIAHAFRDDDNDSVQNNGEPSLPGVTMNDNGYIQITDGNGNATDRNSSLQSGVLAWINMSFSNPFNGITYINPNQTKSFQLNNGNGGSTINFAFVPAQSISGTVYGDTDNDNDNKFDAQDNGLANVTVKITGPTTLTLTTDASGNYNSAYQLLPGNYTVTVTPPQGYTSLTNLSFNVKVGPGCSTGGNLEATCTGPNNQSINNLNFPLRLPFQISGKVYNDIDKDSYIDHTYDGPDTPISPSTSVRISGGSVNLNLTTDASGNYTSGQVLPPGSYTVTATLPSGFSFINTYIGSYTVTVGNGCSVGGNPEATCGPPNNNQSINNLNYAMTNENSWPQPVCGDTRYDTGYSQLIPGSADCNGTSGPYAIIQNGNICPVSPGILYSGATNPSYGQGLGPSTSGQIIGDGLFPEMYSPRLPNTIQTSYSFVNTTITTLNIPTTPLTSICPSLINCVLSETTPGGVYTTNVSDGPVSISVSNSDGSFALGNTTYAFVIGGNLTFTSNINVSSNPSATGEAAFISGGDIHVAGNVGESVFTSTNTNLRGFFSSDKNFYVDALNPPGQQCQANGQPKENKLNIKGSVVVDAAKNGGSIVDNRDGCLQDLSCPTITFTPDLPGIINIMGNGGNIYASGALKIPYSFWQELNP